MATPEEIALERGQLKALIGQALKRVPASINAGSVQDAREFKRFHAEASKKIASDRTSIEALRALRLAVDNTYREKAGA